MWERLSGNSKTTTQLTMSVVAVFASPIAEAKMHKLDSRLNNTLTKLFLVMFLVPFPCLIPIYPFSDLLRHHFLKIIQEGLYFNVPLCVFCDPPFEFHIPWNPRLSSPRRERREPRKRYGSQSPSGTGIAADGTGAAHFKVLDFFLHDSNCI